MGDTIYYIVILKTKYQEVNKVAINEKIMSNNKKIGYARANKYDQNLKMQLDALKEYGCEEQNIYTDKVSGSKAERPGLSQALE